MGEPAGPALPPITEEDYERMKRRVWIMYEPQLRALAKERAQSQVSQDAMRLLSGVNVSFDDVYQQRLRQIHAKIAAEIDALPKPTGHKPPKTNTPPILDRLPKGVRDYIMDSIGQRGLKITDDATLIWMGDIVSQPEDRLPSVYGAGIRLNF